MAGLFDKVSRYARGPQGKQLREKAQKVANDPRNKERINKVSSRLRKSR
jgi:hypothetical protein